MKCQNCGQNEANFFSRTNINGQITESHLCSECAENLGLMQSFAAPVPAIFDEFFGRLDRMQSPFAGFSPFFEIQPRYMTPGIATAPPESARMQPPPQPSLEIDDNMKKQREINILREQMRDAAAREDFERAMSLRDEIKRLEA